MFTRLQENLTDKLHSLTVAEEKLGNLQQEVDAVSWINSRLIGKEFVLFCGAGISIPGSSSAPGFLELRDNLIIAIIQNLYKRGVIGWRETRAIKGAIRQMPIRRGFLSFPPEMVFSSIQESLGLNVLASILSCLNQGRPNENHQAIKRLAEQSNSGLMGVITPNFDMYIEKALEGLPHTVYISSYNPEKGTGFPVVKPHGGLQDMASIVITLEELRTPLRKALKERIKQLISNRTVLVIGYSGMDYDLFPLLVHAGKFWNTQVVWILWKREAINSQVWQMQVALGHKCIVLDGQERNILAELGNLKMAIKPGKARNIAHQFTDITRECATIDLIYALITILGPLGMLSYSKINERLLEAQLDQLLKYGYESDAHRLKLILQVVKFSENAQLKISAIELGKKIALASGNGPWLRQFQYYQTILNMDEDDLDAQLLDIEFTLRENFFPYLERYGDMRRTKLERYMRLSQLRRKAEILFEKEEYDEAEKNVRGLLGNYHFPKTGVSDDAAMYDEPAEEGILHYTLARILSERGQKEEAEKELCYSLDILWPELSTLGLSFALSIAQEILFGSLSKRSIGLVLTLGVKIAHVSGDVQDELNWLVDKLESGFGDEHDLESTELLLNQAKDNIDLQDYEELVARAETARKTWFRDGKAIFLGRMLMS